METGTGCLVFQDALVLVAGKAQVTLQGLGECRMTVGTLRFDISMRLADRPRHNQRLDRSGVGGNLKTQCYQGDSCQKNLLVIHHNLKTRFNTCARPGYARWPKSTSSGKSANAICARAKTAFQKS